jgi:hypothetical protein
MRQTVDSKTVGAESDPPENKKDCLFSPMEGRPPCRPQEFCMRITRLRGKVP